MSSLFSLITVLDILLFIWNYRPGQRLMKPSSEQICPQLIETCVLNLTHASMRWRWTCTHDGLVKQGPVYFQILLFLHWNTPCFHWQLCKFKFYLPAFLDRLDQKTCIGHLPRLFTSAMTCFLSDRAEVAVSATGVLKVCLKFLTVLALELNRMASLLLLFYYYV